MKARLDIIVLSRKPYIILNGGCGYGRSAEGRVACLPDCGAGAVNEHPWCSQVIGVIVVDLLGWPNHREEFVADIDVFDEGLASCICLGDQMSLQVVVKYFCTCRSCLAHPLVQGIIGIRRTAV